MLKHDVYGGPLPVTEGRRYCGEGSPREATSVLRVPRGDPRFTVPKWPGLVLTIPLMTGIPGLILAGTVAALVVGAFALVICPAVWSRKPSRKKAALDVMRIFRKIG